jgi:hypothetical protein
MTFFVAISFRMLPLDEGVRKASVPVRAAAGGKSSQVARNLSRRFRDAANASTPRSEDIAMHRLEAEQKRTSALSAGVYRGRRRFERGAAKWPTGDGELGAHATLK